MDQAAALRELKVNLGLPWEKLAQRLGLTKRRVLELVGLLDLPEKIKEDIRQKKLTEKHSRALRQLLDRAEVLREVVNFMKEKKLTGDQSLELVREIKSKPGFTMEESYNQILQFKNKTSKNDIIKKEPLKILVNEGHKFLNILNTLNPEAITEEVKNLIKDNLVSIKNKIQLLLDKLL